jgi:hypothetical protein
MYATDTTRKIVKGGSSRISPSRFQKRVERPATRFNRRRTTHGGAGGAVEIQPLDATAMITHVEHHRPSATEETDQALVCSPNEDFGPSKNMWVRAFVSTFHTHKYSIWAKRDENFLQKVLPTYFSTFQNLRLASITCARNAEAMQSREWVSFGQHRIFFTVCD